MIKTVIYSFIALNRELLTIRDAISIGIAMINNSDVFIAQYTSIFNRIIYSKVWFIAYSHVTIDFINGLRTKMRSSFYLFRNIFLKIRAVFPLKSVFMIRIFNFNSEFFFGFNCEIAIQMPGWVVPFIIA